MTLDPHATRWLRDPASLAAVQAAADLPTKQARDGRPTLTLRGTRLHSAVKPQAEAATQLEASVAELEAALRESPDSIVTVVVYGPGLGYPLAALQDVARALNALTRLRVVCVEADPEVARKALQLAVWEPCELAVTWIVGLDNIVALREAVGTTPVVTVCATAGFRLHRDSYDALARRQTNASAPGRPLRILVPTPLYGGSLPTAFHCADAFRALGHQVEVLDLSPYYPLFKHAETVTADLRHRRTLQGLLTTHLAETIVARALDWKADLVWAVAQTPLLPAALEELRQAGVHTALWFVEDFRVFSYWRELARHFDAIFTIQRGLFHEELRQAGARNVAYLPCAANPEVHRPLELSSADTARFGSAVSFVGAGYYNRQALFAGLNQPDFKIWGCDWPSNCAVASRVQEQGRRVTTEDTAAIYNATRVNINLHSSPNHEGVNPAGDFVNPRTFEVAACGAFQLVDARAELADLFEIGSELAVFRRAEELPELIAYYLSHDAEREAMASRARARVLREHTYSHRMQSAVEFLEARLPRLSERRPGANYAASLKAAAGSDRELQDFLAAFPDSEELSLDTIVSRIELGKGELTRPEGLFLLMKEFRDWGREKGVIQ